MWIITSVYIYLALWFTFSGEEIQWIHEVLSKYGDVHSLPLWTFEQIFGLRDNTIPRILYKIFGLKFALWAMFVLHIIFGLCMVAFVLGLFSLCVVIGVKEFTYLMLIIYDEVNFGLWIALALSYLLYCLILLPLIIAYLTTYIISLPYLLVEQISNWLGLRPMLVFFGGVISLLGTFLQLFY
jgi:hypothetical protein